MLRVSKYLPSRQDVKFGVRRAQTAKINPKRQVGSKYEDHQNCDMVEEGTVLVSRSNTAHKLWYRVGRKKPKVANQF